jgi:hypothetical protein
VCTRIGSWRVGSDPYLSTRVDSRPRTALAGDHGYQAADRRPPGPPGSRSPSWRRSDRMELPDCNSLCSILAGGRPLRSDLSVPVLAGEPLTARWACGQTRPERHMRGRTWYGGSRGRVSSTAGVTWCPCTTSGLPMPADYERCAGGPPSPGRWASSRWAWPWRCSGSQGWLPGCRVG